VSRVIELAERGTGEVLDAAGRAENDASRLEVLFTAARPWPLISAVLSR
jgi:hypothetical protein